MHSLLWGRDTSADAAANFLRKMGAELLVSGHIACNEGFAVPNDRQVIVDCAETPAGYVLFPADRPLTHQELVACMKTFSGYRSTGDNEKKDRQFLFLILYSLFSLVPG